MAKYERGIAHYFYSDNGRLRRNLGVILPLMKFAESDSHEYGVLPQGQFKLCAYY